MELTPQDMEKLASMLGARATTPKGEWGVRNRYAAVKGSDSEKDLMRMATDGLVREGRGSETMSVFHATEAGCKAMGLNKACTKRALDV